jgi:hypothetical protein
MSVTSPVNCSVVVSALQVFVSSTHTNLSAALMQGATKQHGITLFLRLLNMLCQHLVRQVEPAAYRVWFADGYGSSSGGGRDGGCTLDMFYDVQHMVEQLEQVEEGAGEQPDHGSHHAS